MSMKSEEEEGGGGKATGLLVQGNHTHLSRQKNTISPSASLLEQSQLHLPGLSSTGQTGTRRPGCDPRCVLRAFAEYTSHAASPTRYLTVDLDFFFERSPLILISCLYIKTDRGHELTTDCRLPSAPRAKCPRRQPSIGNRGSPGHHEFTTICGHPRHQSSLVLSRHRIASNM
jgi:hypothetical protein